MVENVALHSLAPLSVWEELSEWCTPVAAGW